MLSDYIPVYWPCVNAWSIPNYELMGFRDFVPEPQDITLWEDHVVRGIPLLHFGTWGIMGVNVTEMIRGFVKDPESIAKDAPDRKYATKTAAFFKELKRRYPKIVSVRMFKGGTRRASKCLDVPMQCIVHVNEKDLDG